MPRSTSRRSRRSSSGRQKGDRLALASRSRRRRRGSSPPARGLRASRRFLCGLGGLPPLRPDDRRGGERVDAMRLDDLDLLEPRRRERVLELPPGQGAGDAAGLLGHVGSGGLVHIRRRRSRRRRRSARPGFSTRAASREDLRLVAGEVDHAVGDHDVDASSAGSGISSIWPYTPLDVLDAGLAAAFCAGECEHLVGHVEADRPCRSGRPGGPRCSTSMPPPEPRSSTVSPGVQLGHRGRVAAAERGPSSPCREARRGRHRRRGAAPKKAPLSRRRGWRSSRSTDPPPATEVAAVA